MRRFGCPLRSRSELMRRRSLFDHRASADEQVKKSQGARSILNSGDRRPLPAVHPVVHHAVLTLGPRCP